jgi:hypothetical protein
MTIYYIPEGNVAEFKKRISRLQRRAQRLEAQLDFTIDLNDFKDVKHEFTNKKNEIETTFVRYFKVTVEGEQPKYKDWRFIGTLEHTDEGTILRMVPNEEAPTRYRDVKPFCEHCQVKRNRRDTFLVSHASGEVKQVGSTCLVDFLGHENPHRLAQLAEIWINLSELGDLASHVRWIGGDASGLNHPRRYDLITFLSYVAEITLRHGFISRSMAEKLREKRGPDARVPEVTAHFASRLMIPPTPEDHDTAIDYTPTQPAIDLAEAARSWVLQKYGTGMDVDSVASIKKSLISLNEQANMNDFEHNLYVVAKGEALEPRTFGIGAYIIQAYRRANNLIPEAKKPRVNSEHFGTVGQRLRKLEVTCDKVFTFDSMMYGQGYIFKMITVDGNVMVWKTYNVSDDKRMEEGHRFTVTATVKAHEVYNGEKQTEVSRVLIDAGLIDFTVAVEQELKETDTQMAVA